MRINLLIVIMLIYWVTLGCTVAYATDPTKPENVQDVAGENPWNLTAIYISSGRRVAIIQGNFVKVGDKVDNAEILAIEPSYVILKNNDGTFKVFLGNWSIKTPVKQ